MNSYIMKEYKAGPGYHHPSQEIELCHLPKELLPCDHPNSLPSRKVTALF